MIFYFKNPGNFSISQSQFSLSEDVRFYLIDYHTEYFSYIFIFSSLPKIIIYFVLYIHGS